MELIKEKIWNTAFNLTYPHRSLDTTFHGTPLQTVASLNTPNLKKPWKYVSSSLFIECMVKLISWFPQGIMFWKRGKVESSSTKVDSSCLLNKHVPGRSICTLLRMNKNNKDWLSLCSIRMPGKCTDCRLCQWVPAHLKIESQFIRNCVGWGVRN